MISFWRPPCWLVTDTVSLSPQAKVQEDMTDYTITLHSASITPFVWLDVENIPGRFSSNGFLMVSRNVTVSFHPWCPTSVTELSKSLTITSLRDVYWPETSQTPCWGSPKCGRSSWEKWWLFKCPFKKFLLKIFLTLWIFERQKDIFEAGEVDTLCHSFLLSVWTYFVGKQKLFFLIEAEKLRPPWDTNSPLKISKQRKLF